MSGFGVPRPTEPEEVAEPVVLTDDAELDLSVDEAVARVEDTLALSLIHI